MFGQTPARRVQIGWSLQSATRALHKSAQAGSPRHRFIVLPYRDTDSRQVGGQERHLAVRERVAADQSRYRTGVDRNQTEAGVQQAKRKTT
jgi:hypothetical protein